MGVLIFINIRELFENFNIRKAHTRSMVVPLSYILKHFMGYHWVVQRA